MSELTREQLEDVNAKLHLALEQKRDYITALEEVASAARESLPYVADEQYADSLLAHSRLTAALTKLDELK